MTKIKRKYDTISGSNYDRVREQLLEKTFTLYQRLERNYEELASKSRKSNVREMLREFAREAKNDWSSLSGLVDGNVMHKFETAERAYGMFDHIDSSDTTRFNEEEKAIIDAIRISRDLKDIFARISVEYGDPKIKHIFDTLARHEIHRKNELEVLYDELIVRGEW